MKSAVFCSVFATVSLLALNSFGQGTCHSGGNSGPDYPYGEAGDSYYPTQTPAGYPTAGPLGATPYANAAPPSGPTARITLVSANTSSDSRTTSNAPTAKLTVVADDSPAAPKVAVVADEEPAALDSTIAGLVGTWKAVARHGDGELTTVELHLDNRGWAELTVPGNDGKPSTTRSRVNLENQELKLTGSDQVVSLGKLVDFNSRQMVLERAEGQVTFVRL